MCQLFHFNKGNVVQKRLMTEMSLSDMDSNIEVIKHSFFLFLY